MAKGFANERVFSIDDHGVNTRRVNLSLSVNDILFLTVL